jgi:hypothetical protein
MLKKIKKSWPHVIGVFCLVILFNACSMKESKIKSIVDREIGSALIVERARLEIEKQTGKGDSKLKVSLLEMVRNKISIEYTEVIVEGRRGRVRVHANIPRLETLGALFSESRNMPKEKMLDMTANEWIKEINRNSRRPASENDLQVDTYEFYIDFEKNKDWVADQEQLKKAYSQKNLIY